MTLTTVRVALVAAGILIWAYGTRVDDPALRWAGIAVLVVALLLRFVRRRRPPGA